MLPRTDLTGSDPSPATRAAAVDLTLAALDALVALGETVDGEWDYVNALADAGRARLRTAADVDQRAPLSAAAGAAVIAASAEAGRISDPHRAIDWLSTLPAVVELALAPAPGTEARPAAADPHGVVADTEIRPAAPDRHDAPATAPPAAADAADEAT